jgi:probable rRNA maturation factor
MFEIIWEHPSEETLAWDHDRFFRDVFEVLAIPESDGVLVLVDRAQMTHLNETYRHKDGPTDVLSFPPPDYAKALQPDHLGDIVICYEVAQEQAQQHGWPLEHELSLLTLHGLLHLLGYDHEQDDGEMMALQQKLTDQLNTWFGSSPSGPDATQTKL